MHVNGNGTLVRTNNAANADSPRTVDEFELHLKAVARQVLGLGQLVAARGFFDPADPTFYLEGQFRNSEGGYSFVVVAADDEFADSAFGALRELLENNLGQRVVFGVLAPTEQAHNPARGWLMDVAGKVSNMLVIDENPDENSDAAIARIGQQLKEWADQSATPSER